jgi:hypothetical protein
MTKFKRETRIVRANSRAEAMAHVRRIETLTEGNLIPEKAKLVKQEYEVTYHHNTRMKKSPFQYKRRKK